MSRPGIKSATLDSSVNGSILEASRPDGLSMPEKHELVYEIARGSEGGPEILQSWTRKELLHILCAEMGKERKYTGLPKWKMIEHLLKIVALKKSRPQETAQISLVSSTPANAPGPFRRQRKREHPSRHPEATALSLCANEADTNVTRVCKNYACRAVLSLEDRFCRRCSCCICHKFDDNKDPSVWLVCSSESPSDGVSCGLSCHLECALKHEKSGIAKVAQHMQLDGSYCCPSCGRVSGLMGCWKKQLTIAKEARRVDILCYRISLAQRLLNGTEQFKEPHDIVLRAARKLEEEVGPINGESSTMARGIVSRLSSGNEVQKLCALAIEKMEALASLVSSPGKDLTLRAEDSLPAACRIEFEGISPTSLVVLFKEIDPNSAQDVIGYKLWHRTSRDLKYPKEISCVLPRTQTRVRISNLRPCTEYAFRIVSYTNRGDLGLSEAKCFTDSVEVFRRNIRPSTKQVLKKPGNTGTEDFRSPSAKGELESQPNEGFSSFKVRDLGKIFRAAWVQERDLISKIDCTEKNMPINPFNCFEKAEACDSDKPFVSSDGEVNIVSTSPLEVSRDDQIGCNLVQVAEPEGGKAESISALNEESVMAGMGTVKMSHARRRSQKDSTKSNIQSHAIKLSKKDQEYQSKVTISRKMPIKRKCDLLAANDLAVLPLDCSYPVFPLDTCKSDDPKTRILRNGRAHSNGSDSENWAVQPIREVPAVESQNVVSRKRSLSTYGDLHGCDGVLLNGCHESSSDTPDCLEKKYEDSVGVIRWLECRGHIEEEFRKKFLTWFSVRATSEQRGMVYAFIENLLDDPASLAEQLVDTFSDMVSKKRPQSLPNGFCTKLWH